MRLLFGIAGKGSHDREDQPGGKPAAAGAIRRNGNRFEITDAVSRRSVIAPRPLVRRSLWSAAKAQTRTRPFRRAA
jgi:hypothetical protein